MTLYREGEERGREAERPREGQNTVFAVARVLQTHIDN
jgi:hypothetical protein